MTMFSGPADPAVAAAPSFHPKRPSAWSLSNWPVRYKVLAIVLVPLILATIFGGLRVKGALANSSGLRVAAARADLLPTITKYMSALDVALLANSTGRDVEEAKQNYAARKGELQSRLDETDVIPDVRSGVSALLGGGQALLDKVSDNSIGVRERVTTYAPLLLTAEDVIDASVRVEDEQIRAQAQGLSRAVGARGQMTMQEILIARGAELPEPQLRTAMITLAGTEPSTLFGMSEVVGVGSTEAKTLQQQMVTRMAIMSDPASVLVDNPDLLRSIQTTDGIAEQVIDGATASVTNSVHAQATDRRDAALADAGLVLAAIAIALVIVLLVARALVVPLRILRDGALKVAHTDLEEEVARVKAGGAEPIPDPLPVYTSEEIGQVAHAVDELHSQALLLAGDEARLRLLVNDMFETMSRRSRSLVDQQLSLIDGLERNEEDPERLDSLFRLDHLAARLRRNSANLLVLAGAQLARDQRQPVGLSTVLNAAVSEVEDYRRVDISELPDCSLAGAVAGGVIHLFAELIDNALRYSPPTTSVRISARRGGDASVVLRIADSGLGMNEADRRIANKRLQDGGEISPENARHMGLFVVGRIAAQHGIRVGLRAAAPDEAGSGTTAEIYLPPAVFEGTAVAAAPQRRAGAVSSPSAKLASAIPAREAATESPEVAEQRPAPQPLSHNGSGAPVPPVTLLPRRSPGSSVITGVPDQPAAQRPRRELATAWWEGQNKPAPAPNAAAPPAPNAAAPPAPNAPPPAPNRGPRPVPPRAPVVSYTSVFFAAKPQPAKPGSPDDDVIYRRMLNEMMGDPHELVNSPDLDWQSVWDRGWSLAAEAEDKPVAAHTADFGLPVRAPGARLVPGTAAGSDSAEQDHRAADDAPPLVASNGRPPQHAAAARDPEAVRASFSNHFGGVRSGRSQARHVKQGPDQE
ncbi:MAG TPA: ATP-binding protein [Mycobacterium sp.]